MSDITRKTDKCTSILGHCFEPRYDSIPPENYGELSGGQYAVLRTFELLTKKIYVRDVCSKCGATIEREKK